MQSYLYWKQTEELPETSSISVIVLWILFHTDLTAVLEIILETNVLCASCNSSSAISVQVTFGLFVFGPLADLLHCLITSINISGPGNGLVLPKS